MAVKEKATNTDTGIGLFTVDFVGVRNGKIGFRLKEVYTKVIYWFITEFRDEYVTTKDGNKTLYVNEEGRTFYAASEEELPRWFCTSEYRGAWVGEKEIVSLLVALLRPEVGDVVAGFNRHRLLEGNVSELTNLIVSSDSQLVALVGYRSGEPAIWSRFLPSHTYNQFKSEVYSDSIKEWVKELKYFNAQFDIKCLNVENQ